MVFGWCPHRRKSGLLHSVVCEPRCRTPIPSFLASPRYPIYMLLANYAAHSGKSIRVLIFNITQERSGISFLAAIIAAQSTQLTLHASDEDPQGFFDHVIFCSNVT